MKREKTPRTTLMDHYFHDGTRRLRILGGIIQNKNMRNDQGSTNQDPKTENLRALSKLYFNGQKSKKLCAMVKSLSLQHRPSALIL